MATLVSVINGFNVKVKSGAHYCAYIEVPKMEKAPFMVGGKEITYFEFEFGANWIGIDYMSRLDNVDIKEVIEDIKIMIEELINDGHKGGIIRNGLFS